jgi:two-component system chemotaxis sensor kinase CheA
MLFAALGDHGEALSCKPAIDEIELFDARVIEAWLISEHDEDVIAATAREVSEVASVECHELPALEGAPAAPAPAPVPAAVEPLVEPVTEEPTPVRAPDEPAPAPARAAKHTSQSATRTVRVDAERLDSLMDLMGELVIHRTAVEALTQRIDIPGLHEAVQELTRSSHALQAMVMKVRMIPVDVVLLRLPRLVRDLSSKLGKEVKLNLVGSDTELDRTVVDALGDPLVHLVRNSLDHGIERPAERQAAGKPRIGQLEIAARHVGRSVVISVKDDGRGLDPKLIARKAVEKGLIDEAAAGELDMRGAIELLFAPGFSTADAATDVSGRGVGMDAVRAQIRGLGGEVVVESTHGEGTTAQIRLPLTLAIVSALQIDIAGAPFAIPLDRVERTVRISEQTVRSVAGRPMLVLEDGVLPLLDGAQIFGRESAGEHLFAVVVRAHDRRLALAVDDLVGQRELVTRPLPAVVADGEPVSAGAALADGQLALVVDCDQLAANALSGIQLGLTTSAASAGGATNLSRLAA